ncbi:MAG: glycosyltransferase family 39 protein [Chloroflexi bacterium]|nr:glycosyltransferase family 39 protein [Chloroflexota bacterium]
MELTILRSRPITLPHATALLALLAVVLLAAVVRFADLGTESYWLDEIIMARLTSGELEPMLRHLAEGDRPPVFVLLGYTWSSVFGTSEAATRSLSATAGVLSVVVFYAITQRLLKTPVALIACWIMALSAFQIHYSQEYRYYMVFQLALLLTVYCYLRVLDTGHWLDMLLYAVSSIISLYVHTYAVFFLAGLALHFLLHWRRFAPLRRRWVVAQVVIAVAIAPRLWSTVSGMMSDGSSEAELLSGGTPVTDWVPAPPLYAPLRSLVNFLFIERSMVSWWLIGAAALAVLLGTLLYLRHTGLSYWRGEATMFVRRARAAVIRFDWRLTLLAVWLVVPIALPFIVSKVFAPMYLDRYVIAAAPAWYLVIAAGLYAARRLVPVALTVSVLTVLLLGSLYTYYSAPQKEQWRETAAYVSQHARPSEPIALAYGRLPRDAYNVRDSFYWYYPTAAVSNCFVDVWQPATAVTRELADCSAGQRRLWLVVYQDRQNTDTSWLPGVLAAGLKLRDTRSFVGTSVYLLELPAGQ